MDFKNYLELFESIEKNIDMSSKTMFSSEYPKKISDKLYSKKEIIRREQDDIFYYIDVENLNSIVNYQTNFNKLKQDSELYECCICYEYNIKRLDAVYMECNHIVCKECSSMIKNNRCPMCRREIWDIYDNDKFCIISLGEKTDRYNFDNGGYYSIKLLFLPKFKEDSIVIFRTIKYNDNDPEKIKFLEILNDAIDNGYSLVIQNKEQFIKWAEYVYIDWFFKVYDVQKTGKN